MAELSNTNPCSQRAAFWPSPTYILIWLVQSLSCSPRIHKSLMATFSLSYVFVWLCSLCSWAKFSLTCFLFKYSGTLSLHACVTCAAVPSSLCPVLVCSYQTSQPPSGTTRGASGVAPGIWVLADWGSSAPWGIYGTQHCSAWWDNVGTTPAAGWHCVAVLQSDDLSYSKTYMSELGRGLSLEGHFTFRASTCALLYFPKLFTNNLFPGRVREGHRQVFVDSLDRSASNIYFPLSFAKFFHNIRKAMLH